MACIDTKTKECISASSGDACDVEVLIAKILADPSCDSLELPCLLNAEQRKHAKKVVGEHPSLKCESFGMGSDRRLHVFKCKQGEGVQPLSDCSPHRVNVKNTFIDDWADAEEMNADKRIVQSMPHNMFGQCLAAEQNEVSSERREVVSQPNVNEDAAPAASCIAQPDTAIEEQVFALGSSVVISGLTKAPGFNGSVGIVQSWDAESARYNILLAATATSGHRWAKVKAENLLLSLA